MDGPAPRERLNSLKKPEWVPGDHAYILIQTETGQAAIVAAALRDGPGGRALRRIARAHARDIDELAQVVTSQVQVLDGVRRTMTCPVVHL
jgi:hypothetical protein